MNYNKERFKKEKNFFLFFNLKDFIYYKYICKIYILVDV